MNILVTRPEPDASLLAGQLREMGHEPLVEPLFTIETLPTLLPGLDDAQAILLTSANGARAIAKATDIRRLPVYAVGDTTAKAARLAGFEPVISANGDVGDLATLVRGACSPDAGKLVHIAGTVAAGDLAGELGRHGYAVNRVVLYEARVSTKLSPTTVSAIQAGKVDAALVYSPRGAILLCQLLKSAALAGACTSIDLLCLSKAVAKAATGLSWRSVVVAARPDGEAMLDLINGSGP